MNETMCTVKKISYSFSLVDQFIRKLESNSKDHGH